MTEEARERRRRLDHERYVRNREERKRRQKEYYRAHRSDILARVRLRRLGLYERPKMSEEAVTEAKNRKKARDRNYYRKNSDKILSYFKSYRERVRNGAGNP